MPVLTSTEKPASFKISTARLDMSSAIRTDIGSDMAFSPSSQGRLRSVGCDRMRSLRKVERVETKRRDQKAADPPSHLREVGPSANGRATYEVALRVWAKLACAAATPEPGLTA